MAMLLSPYLKVRGWSYQESPAGTPRAPAGTVYRPKATQDFAPNFSQAALEDMRDLDQYMISHPSYPGVKSFTAALLAMLHETSHTELAPLIKCCLGKRSSTAVLTIGAGPHTAAVIGMLNANLPAPIIQIEGDDGLYYERPVKEFNTGTFALTLAIELPAGVLPVAVNNPAAAGGDCWQESQDAGATFRVEMNRHGQTQEVKGLADLCVPSEMSLRYDAAGRLAFGIGWTGAEWTLGAAPNVQAVGKNEEQFLSFNSTFFWNDLVTPTAPVKIPLRGFTLDLAPEWVPIPGQTGEDGSAADPESNLIIWERGKALVKGLTLQFATSRGQDGYTERENVTTETKQAFFRFKSKVGGVNVPTRVLSIWFPEVSPDDNPVKGANGGVEAEDNLYKIGQSTLLSAVTGLLTKAVVAITEYP